MEEKKLNIISKLKLRNNISNVLKPFFNKIMIFPNMLKKATTVSENMNNKKIFKVSISDNPLELLQKEIKAENLDKIIPEKNDLTQIVSPEKEIDKSKIFFIEDIKVSPEISEAIFNHEMYGKGDLLMLEPQELAKIPNVIDGHEISKFEKLQLATGSLDFPTYGTTYQIENNSIVKTQLNEELVPEKTVLKKSDVVFDGTKLREEIYLKNNPEEIPKITQAENLPEGWKWRDWEDGSGSLQSPENKSYFGYDLQTAEFQSINGKNDFQKVQGDFNLKEFKNLAENHLLNISDSHEIHPKLSNEERRQLIVINSNNIDRYSELGQRSVESNQIEYGLKPLSKDEEKELNDLHNKIHYSYPEFSAEKLKNIASEVRQNPSLFLQLDSYERNAIKNLFKSTGEDKKFDMMFNKHMSDTWAQELTKRTDLSKGMTYNQIDAKQADFYRKYESAAKSLNLPVTPYVEKIPTNAELNASQQKNLEFLEKNIKNLGFSLDENFKMELGSKLKGNEANFSINQNTDKNFFKSNEISFNLNFHRSKETGTVFFNNYQVQLENRIKQLSLSHNVNLRQIPFSAKEAVNLIEGRSVRTDINYKNGKKENVFLKLDFNSQKEDGNYNLKKFNPKYGINTDEILKNTNVFIAQDREDIHKRIIKSLEKGNVVPLLIKNDDGKIDKFNAVLNPQYKTINLYNSKMERVKEKESLEVGAKQEVIQSENVSQTNTSRKI